MEPKEPKQINIKQYKYFAFISYSSKDAKWGKWLHCKLESYKLPSILCSEKGWSRKPMSPVFFAPYEIQPGGLDKELQKRLEDSQFLIVIGSPNSAKSEWVAKEIEYFNNLGRPENIHYFIVDGIPNSGNTDTECYNPVLKKLEMPEILGCNIHERVFRWSWMNKERAFIQLVSKLLGVDFDVIWQRHKRNKRRKIMAWLVGGIAVISALGVVWIINQPVDVMLRIHEVTVPNQKLPQLRNAQVTMILDNETKTENIATLNDDALFPNIPHGMLGKEVKISVKADYYNDLDTIIKLDEMMDVGVARDPHVYGDIHFHVYDKNIKPLPYMKLNIHGHETTSDNNGYVKLFIPIEEQDTVYCVTASRTLEDEQIFPPCGDDDAIFTVF